MSALVYRKDIQILRGVAVLFVVLYHLNVWGFNNSGFLGVDIFFVISGYLMAVMFDPGKVLEFFKKRARRLLPAYFAVVLLSVIVAVFKTAPGEYHQVSEQAGFAALYSSNIGFWLGDSYWENNEFRPLLHLWSLGVEIQYYLLVPLVYWLYKKNRLVISILVLISLFLCAVNLGVSPKGVFFMLPYRLWQFLMGFIAAKYVSGGGDNRFFAPRLAGLFSLAIVLSVPFVTVDTSGGTFIDGHPGFPALLISIATAGVLAVGVPKWIENNFLSGFLEKIGKYSYSIYLAHFPVIVFYLYQPFSGTVVRAGDPGEFAWLIILIVFFSVLLYYFVERPMRAYSLPFGSLILFPMAVLVFVSAGQWAQKAMVPEREMLIYQALFDRDEWRCGTVNRLFRPLALDCELEPAAASPDLRIFLVGDSHADAIKTTFLEAARSQNVSVYFMVENDPLYEGGLTPGQLVETVKARGAQAIVLHYSPLAPLPPGVLQDLASSASRNGIHLAFIMPVPYWEKNVLVTLIDHVTLNSDLPYQTVDDYMKMNREKIDMLHQVRYDKFKVYPVVDVFCDPVCQVLSGEGKPYYFDNGHLTLTGSKLLRSVFSRLLSDLK